MSKEGGFVAELAYLSPFSGLNLPFEIAEARLAALPRARIMGIAPFRGCEAAVSDALAAAVGAGLPDVGRATRLAGGRLIWAGIGQWVLTGSVAAAGMPALTGLAALTDQSDGWACMTLDGSEAPEILARLLPLDLDTANFPSDAAARSLLRHVACLLVAGEAGCEIMVPRSFARTVVHELTEAMRGVAGRRALEARERSDPA